MPLRLPSHKLHVLTSHRTRRCDSEFRTSFCLTRFYILGNDRILDKLGRRLRLLGLGPTHRNLFNVVPISEASLATNLAIPDLVKIANTTIVLGLTVADEELLVEEEPVVAAFAGDAVRLQTIQAAVMAAMENALTLVRYGCACT